MARAVTVREATSMVAGCELASSGSVMIVWYAHKEVLAIKQNLHVRFDGDAVLSVVIL